MNNAEIKTFIDDFTEKISDLGKSLGLNRSVVKLYALLYFSPRALSLDEMSARLKISKGNVSMNIRLLEGWEAVRKVGMRGSRKDYYEADLDVLRIVLKRAREGLNRRLGQSAGLLQTAERFISENNTGDALSEEEIKIFQERVERMKKIQQSLMVFLSTVLPE